MIRVYVAGPLTTGNAEHNVGEAIMAADDLIEAGFAPFVPHLSFFQDAVAPRDYEQWMALDFVWLEACDVVLRLPGASPGADRETARAKELRIPVFDSIDWVVEWAAALERDEAKKRPAERRPPSRNYRPEGRLGWRTE